MKRVSILDFGCGNLASVSAAFTKLNCSVSIVNNPDSYTSECDLLVLPGVGSFNVGINSLRDSGLDVVVRNHIAFNGHLLGICLGFQLLFTHGSEGGFNSGLDLIPGHCTSFASHNDFDSTASLPHVGFSPVDLSPLRLTLSKQLMDFYFVHSFQVELSKNISDKCRVVKSLYGGCTFASAINYGHIWGFQFHPEKSQSNGLILLQSVLASI